MSIVIVDPVKADREKMDELLRSWGYTQVIACSTLDEARKILGLPADTLVYGLELILVDITQSDSFSSFVEDLRSKRFYQDIPVLALSEGSRQEKMAVAFAFGATDFVSKPIAEFELRARVRSCLRLKHEQDRRKAREKELLEASNQLTDLNRMLTKMSLIDSLTGIPNRRCFDENFEQEWKRAFRNGGHIGLILCDVDFFKQYNDTYGHQNGDNCLQRVAQTLKACLKRPGDLVARYGGEEFALILPQTSAKQATTICTNIQSELLALSMEHMASKVSPNVTLSMGIASTEPAITGYGIDILLAKADKALYKAKAAGRNRFIISDEEN